MLPECEHGTKLGLCSGLEGAGERRAARGQTCYASAQFSNKYLFLYLAEETGMVSGEDFLRLAACPRSGRGNHRGFGQMYVTVDDRPLDAAMPETARHDALRSLVLQAYAEKKALETRIRTQAIKHQVRLQVSGH